MSLEHLEVLVEEPSMEALLRALLPRMLGEAARKIGPLLDASRSRSASFRSLCSAVEAMARD